MAIIDVYLIPQNYSFTMRAYFFKIITIFSQDIEYWNVLQHPKTVRQQNCEIANFKIFLPLNYSFKEYQTKKTVVHLLIHPFLLEL